MGEDHIFKYHYSFTKTYPMLLSILPDLLQIGYYRGDAVGSLLKTVLIILLIIIILRAAIAAGNVLQPSAHWHHRFDNFSYSSQEFYAAVGRSIADKGMPGISMTKRSYSEGGLLTANREYLQISRNRQVFLICAAPFGNGFFISCWHYEKKSQWHEFLRKVPYIGAEIVKSLEMKTFYQIDTEVMYKEAVRQSVVDVTHAITEEKGIRSIGDMERSSRESTMYSIGAA